jgi:hypothetical protein
MSIKNVRRNALALAKEDLEEETAPCMKILLQVKPILILALGEAHLALDKEPTKKAVVAEAVTVAVTKNDLNLLDAGLSYRLLFARYSQATDGSFPSSKGEQSKAPSRQQKAKYHGRRSTIMPIRVVLVQISQLSILQDKYVPYPHFQTLTAQWKILRSAQRQLLGMTLTQGTPTSLNTTRAYGLETDCPIH